MLRYFIRISFLGNNYCGWQIQPGQISVQETIEKCMSNLVKEKITIVGAGRTDSGVHATKMYAHFDTKNSIKKKVLIDQNITIKGIAKIYKKFL